MTETLWLIMNRSLFTTKGLPYEPFYILISFGIWTASLVTSIRKYLILVKYSYSQFTLLKYQFINDFNKY